MEGRGLNPFRRPPLVTPDPNRTSSTFSFAPTWPGRRRQCAQGPRHGLKGKAIARLIKHQERQDLQGRGKAGGLDVRPRWTLYSASWIHRSIVLLSRPMLGCSTSTMVAVTAGLQMRMRIRCPLPFWQSRLPCKSIHPLTASFTPLQVPRIDVMTAPLRSKFGIDPSTMRLRPYRYMAQYRLDDPSRRHSLVCWAPV